MLNFLNPQNLGGFISTLVAAPFILIILFIILGLLRDARKATASKRWPIADGRIVSSKVVSHRSLDSDGTHTTIYEPSVAYDYNADGQALHSTRINFGGIAGASFPSMAQSTVDKYPVGSAVQVFYDPAKPSNAVLEHSDGFNGLLIVILGAVELLLIAIVVAGLTGRFN